MGVKFVAMRCAGFDRVDLEALYALGMKIARVPTYSPQSVAEHAVTLALALNRCAIHMLLEIACSSNKYKQTCCAVLMHYALSMCTTCCRHIVPAYNRLRTGNYTLSGLVGMEIHKKTVGIVGTGAIGCCAAKIFKVQTAMFVVNCLRVAVATLHSKR